MITIRNLQPNDDIQPLLPYKTDASWNPEHVFVAEKEGKLIGIVIAFDAGHEVTFIDHVYIIPGQSIRLWLRLLDHVITHYRLQGCTAMFGYVEHEMMDRIRRIVHKRYKSLTTTQRFHAVAMRI